MDYAQWKERATRYAAAARFDKARDVYERLIQERPRDIQLRLRHAEMASRSGQVPQAVASYRAAAHILAELSFLTRAIAALKLALELAPDDPDVVSDLIRLEQRRSGLVPPRRSQAALLEPARPSSPALPQLRPGLPGAPPPDEVPIVVGGAAWAEGVEIQALEPPGELPHQAPPPPEADPLALADTAPSGRAGGAVARDEDFEPTRVEGAALLPEAAGPIEPARTQLIEASAVESALARAEGGGAAATGPLEPGPEDRSRFAGAEPLDGAARGALRRLLEAEVSTEPFVPVTPAPFRPPAAAKAYPQVVRVAPTVLAIQPAKDARWLMVSSASPLEVRTVDDVGELLEPPSSETSPGDRESVGEGPRVPRS